MRPEKRLPRLLSRWRRDAQRGYCHSTRSPWRRRGFKTKAEVEPVIKEALAAKNVVIMDFSISREEGVFPMVPAGKATTEMLLV